MPSIPLAPPPTSSTGLASARRPAYVLAIQSPVRALDAVPSRSGHCLRAFAPQFLADCSSTRFRRNPHATATLEQIRNERARIA